MAEVKACMDFTKPSEFNPPKEDVRKSLQIICDRIYGIEGFENQTNDVIFTGFPDKPRINVIYFGGDIQNYRELMNCDRDSEKFKDEFNLETIGELLLKRFNEVMYPVHVWVVRPGQYINQKFVIFNEFLRMSNEGHPTFMQSCIPINRTEITAIPHIQALICNSTATVNERQRSKYGDICNPNLPCVLVGFSKGCVVLTKNFCELYLQLLCNSFSPIVSTFREMYWLDSGHNGDEMLWPHDHSMFSKMSRSGCLKDISFHAYATPFQIGRPMKLRSCQEFSRFTDILLKLGMQHTSGYLLRGDEINLQTHFDIIKAFPIKRH